MNHLIDYSVFCMGKVGVGFTPAKRCCEQLIQTKITLNQSAFFFHVDYVYEGLLK